MTDVAAAQAIVRTALALRRRAGANVAYQSDMIGWAVDVLGIPRPTLEWSLQPEYQRHQWDGTPDPFVAAAAGLAASKDVGIESATGTGKTFFAAIAELWFLDCWENSLVVTSAPKAAQLELHLWKEIGRLWPRFQRRRPEARLLHLKARIRPGTDEKETWAATGFAAGVGASEESATKAQGFHAEHMLIIIEEMPGMDPAIVTAFENTCTADHNIRLGLGNPDHQFDPLHTFCATAGLAVRISALDHPNVVTGRVVVPGAVGRRSIAQRERKYGRDSRLYQSRVRGISPAEAVDALVRAAWVTDARKRGDPEHPDYAALIALGGGLEALGVDVANSPNGDLGAIARGRGAVCLEVEAKPCPNANLLGLEVAALMRARRILQHHVGVDAVGVGAGAVNELLRLGITVEALQGGPKPIGAMLGTEVEVYPTLRSQMWWQTRVDLQAGAVGLPPDDDELAEDLLAVKWETKLGKIVVEPKESLVVRLGRSPNKGDAFVYWNWVRPRPELVEVDPTPPRQKHHLEVHNRTQRLLEKAKRRHTSEVEHRMDVPDESIELVGTDVGVAGEILEDFYQ